MRFPKTFGIIGAGLPDILLRNCPLSLRRKKIIRDGLVLWLDGKDFRNNPATSLWKDRSGSGNNAVPSNFGYIAPYADILSDYVGKIKASVVENPNIFKGIASETLVSPSGFSFEPSQTSIDKVKTLNSISMMDTTIVNGCMIQNLFSFNLISIFERKYGEIPSTDKTTAGKVAWLKANVNTVSCNWYGFGSCPSGNKAHFNWYSTVWNLSSDNASSTPTLTNKVLNTSPLIAQLIQNDGFVHFLAYTDASDGVTASTIYTDYVSLTMSFKAASGSDEKGGVVFDGVDDSISIPNSGTFTQMYKNGVAITPAGTINTVGTYKNIVAYNRTLTDTEVARNLKVLK